MVKPRCGAKLVLAVGETSPIVGIVYDREVAESSRRETGFTGFFTDAPQPSELPIDPATGTYSLLDSRVRRYCLRCLLEDQQHVASGLDLAREYGVVGYDRGAREWIHEDFNDEAPLAEAV